MVIVQGKCLSVIRYRLYVYVHGYNKWGLSDKQLNHLIKSSNFFLFCLKTCGKPRAEVRLQAHNLIEYDNLEERTGKGSLFLHLRNNNANVLQLKNK